MASLDLGALSYTLKLNREGFTEGINQTKSDMKGLSDGVKTADEANKVFQSNMKNFQSSLQATGVSFENLDQKLRLWAANNKESIGSVEANSQVIETNKAKMAELASQLSKVETVLRETKTIFGENSTEYKKVENSVIELEISYGKLEEENKRLIASNKEMEASTNPSLFEKLKSNVSGVGEATEKLGIKGISVGGILGRTFGSIKSVVMNTAVPIMAGMGLQSLIDKSKAGQQAVGQMNAVLTSTHGVAGMTKDALLNLAQSQSQVTTYSKGANIATENLLLTFTNIGKDVFPSALKAVNDMSTALGQDTKSSAIQLGKALNDPIVGITALSRVGVNFTEQQKQQIKTMVETGHTAEAQKAILAELSKEFGGSAVEAGKSFDGQYQIVKNQIFGIGAGITSQLMPAITSLMSAVNSHIPQIQSIVNSVISGVTTSFKTLGPIVLGIGQDIEKIATSIFPQLNSSSSNLGKTLLGIAQGGLGALKTVFDWMAQHGTVVGTTIAAIAGAMVTYKAVVIATNAVQEVQNGLLAISAVRAGGLAAAQTALKTAEGSATIAQMLLNAAMDANPIGLVIVAIGALVAGLVYAYKHSETFRNIVSNAFNSIKNVAVSVFNFLKGFISKWGTEILVAVAPLIGIPLLIYQHWNGIKTFITNLWNSIKSTTTSIWNSIVNSIKGFVTGVKNTITSTWNGLKSIVSGIWKGIVSVVTAIVTSFVNGITNIWKNMSTGVSTILTGLQNTIKGIWEVIKTVVIGPVLLILDLVTGNFTQLSQDAQTIFTNLERAFTNIWNGIHQIFAGAVQTIVGFVIRAFQNASSNIQVIWSTVSSFLSSLWTGIVSTAQSIWNGFTSFLSNLWTSITSTATNAWNSLRSAVTSIITAIVSTAQNIWNGLLNWFAALPGRLYNLGVGIFDSMKNGVSSALSTLGSVVQNGFNSAISFITSLPSKAIKWGEDFIDGLINGITSKVGAVGNAVSGVADKIRSFLHFSVPDEGPLKLAA